MTLPSGSFYHVMIQNNIYNLTPHPPTHPGARSYLDNNISSVTKLWGQSAPADQKTMSSTGKSLRKPGHCSLWCWEEVTLRCWRCENLSSTEDLDQVTCGHQAGRSTASRGVRWWLLPTLLIVLFDDNYNYGSYLDCLFISLVLTNHQSRHLDERD